MSILQFHGLQYLIGRSDSLDLVMRILFNRLHYCKPTLYKFQQSMRMMMKMIGL